MHQLQDKIEHNWEAEMECYNNKLQEQLTRYSTKTQTRANLLVVCIHLWDSTMITCNEPWTDQLKTKKDSHQVRVWVQTWRRITGQEVRIECNHFAVEVFLSATMIYLQTKPLINHKEVTFITRRAFKTNETVTQIQFRGETAFKVKQVLVMEVFLPKMVKMRQNKAKNLKN